jgi:hypothetical protein
MFTVDHFVPMLQTLTAEEIGTDSGWTLIKNQRKRPRQKKRFPFQANASTSYHNKPQTHFDCQSKKSKLEPAVLVKQETDLDESSFKSKTMHAGNLRCHFLERNGMKKETVIPRQRIQVIIMK